MKIFPDRKPWKGGLLASTDYQKAIDGDFVLIHFEDVYIEYNRAKSANAQVLGEQNEVVIIQAEGQDSTSELLVGLGQGTRTNYKNYKIEYCPRSPYSTGRQYAVIQVSRIADNLSCIKSK